MKKTIQLSALILILVTEVKDVAGIPDPQEEPIPVGPVDEELDKRLDEEETARNANLPAAASFCATLEDREPGYLSSDKIGEDARNAIYWDQYKWKGSFDVFIDPDWELKYYNRSRILEYMNTALSRLQDTFGSCLQIRLFPEGSSPPTKGDYVHVYKLDQCISQSVGRKGGKQFVGFADNCFNKLAVIHEFTHALGLAHEHNRADRDDYIIINWENIVPEFTRQFQKVPTSSFSTYGVPYDYQSIMHYGDLAYSKNWRHTMDAKNGAFLGGSNFGTLTENDRLKLRRMYKCGD